MTETALVELAGLPTALAHDDLVVETRRLCKRYGAATAIRDVSLQVPAGAVYLLVGPNGAGKSTTIKILLDLVRPTSGEAVVFGLASSDHGAEIRANVGYVPEQLEWGYGWMRVGRLLQHHSRYFPTWDAEYAARLFSAFDIPLAQRMNTLSKGQGRRVHLAMALGHRPPLLVLDEPTDGLDPVMRDETVGVLVDHLADTPTTLLLSTHHVGEVEGLADHIGVLTRGELRTQVRCDTLRDKLRRYRADIPVGWSAPVSLDALVVKRTPTSGALDWIIWGEEANVASELAASGATVRSVTSLNLEEATLALLTKPATKP